MQKHKPTWTDNTDVKPTKVRGRWYYANWTVALIIGFLAIQAGIEAGDRSARGLPNITTEQPKFIQIVFGSYVAFRSLAYVATAIYKFATNSRNKEH